MRERTTPGGRGGVIWGEETVLGEYRRLTRELGRFPTPCEFDRLGAMSFNCVRRRIGNLAAVREQMKGPDEDRWDVPWLKAEWSRLRVACASRSRLLEGRESKYDLAYVISCYRRFPMIFLRTGWSNRLATRLWAGC